MMYIMYTSASDMTESACFDRLDLMMSHRRVKSMGAIAFQSFYKPTNLGW